MGTEVNESGNVRLEAWKHIGRQFLLAMCASFLFLRLILARYLNPEHRFYVHWQRSDVLGIYLAIFVVAVVLFAGYRLVSSLGKLGQFAAQGFFVMFSIFYIKVAVFEMSGLYRETNTIADVAAKIILVLTMLEFLRYRKKALEVVSGLYFVFSPILLIYMFTLFTAYPVRTRVEAQATDSVKSTNECPLRVYIVVFDGMSYQRTFENQEIIKSFPNLARLAERSFVFHRARSTDTMTFHSIPSIICGVKGKRVFQGEVSWFRVGSEIKPHDEYDHIFKQMSRRGFRTKIIGNYLPYAELFRTGVSECEVYNGFKIYGTTPVRVCADFLWNSIQTRCSWIPGVYAACGKIRAGYFVYLAKSIQEDILKTIRDDQISFLFAHCTVPHDPFIFDRAGFLGSIVDVDDESLVAYLGNLRYVDTLLGGILDEMEKCDRMRGSMLIVTADHSFRKDPLALVPGAYVAESTHVPILIHLPGQEKRVDIADSFRLDGLLRLITGYVDLGSRSEVQFREIFAGICREGGWL